MNDVLTVDRRAMVQLLDRETELLAEREALRREVLRLRGVIEEKSAALRATFAAARAST